MKKFILVVSILVFIGLALVILINYYPKEVSINAQGIKYRLGTELVESEKLVHVQIEGKLYKSFSGKRRFEGMIDIEGEEIPVPLDQRQLTIPITNEGWGAISYPYFKYRETNGAVESAHIYQYGSIVINNDFTKVTIFVVDQNQLIDNNGTGWNGESGQMITAPASSRTEAIRISNEIAEKFLRGFQLK
ncbi:hypothetical protein [Paenibacillus segetis]|uniref:Uncharacterized protein n=1 Tax=Paenibacillus segetis TaxID=1325360 RepID=A0ABQ1YCZ4_9BACL|nr:hypothetical protein [Paenibacillus segetis]GGH19974.1 hypothetical protein GCM10008013_17050 [Paenibacillus segetis]